MYDDIENDTEKTLGLFFKDIEKEDAIGQNSGYCYEPSALRDGRIKFNQNNPDFAEELARELEQ